MLPFTTYSFPEPTRSQTDTSKRWLYMVADQALLPAQTELLEKLSAAVKADFSNEVLYINTNLDSGVSFGTGLPADLQLIISFGIIPADLGLWIDLTAPGIRFMENFAFILTSKLPELEKSPAVKKELWRYMQLFMEMQDKPHA